jgi:hypothetical protein
MRHGHHHVLARDQVLVVHVRTTFGDHGAPRHAEFIAYGDQFGLDDFLDTDPRAKDLEEILDLLADLVEFVTDFVTPKRGQAGKPQFQDGARLFFRQIVGAVLVDTVARIVDQPDQRLDIHRRPAPGHQLLARGRRIGRIADQCNDFVDIGNRDGEADQHMGPFARLAQEVLGPPRDHVFAERDERLEHVDQRSSVPACRH